MLSAVVQSRIQVLLRKFKMNSYVQQHSILSKKIKTLSHNTLLVSLLGGALLSSAALAGTTYEVKSGDTLSKIVAKNYPDVARQSYGIIMQDILKKNPDAFSKNNINSLRVGKTLNLSDKEKIEGLKPKPPAPKPVTAAEFKKLQDENTALQKQIAELKEKISSSEASSTQTEQENTDQATTADNAKQLEELKAELAKKQAEIDSLKKEKEEQAKADAASEADKQKEQELQDLVNQLKTENAELKKVDSTALEKQLSEANAELEKQKQAFADLKAKAEEQSKASAELETANQKIQDLQTQLEQLNSLVAKYEAEQTAVEEENKQTSEQADNSAALDEANKKIEDLQTQIEQLNALVDKYEKEQEEASQSTDTGGKSVEDLKTELEQLQALVTKYEADQEDADAQIQKLQEQLKAAGGNADSENTSATSSEKTAKLQAELESLKQENTSLKAEIDAARTQASQDADTIKQLQDKLATATASPPDESSQQAVADGTTDTQQKSSGSGLAIFSWLLPLLAILIGLYLLSRLIKRMRDKKATEEFKAAMVTTGSANTAAAFGIDGSAPVPYQEKASNDNNDSSTETIEEDSLEAAVKLNIAKAYFELQDQEAANEILQEVMIEGSSKQKQEAEKLVH